MNIPSSLLTTMPKPMPAGKMGGEMGMAVGKDGAKGADGGELADFASLLNEEPVGTSPSASDLLEAAIEDSSVAADAELLGEPQLGMEVETLGATAGLTEQMTAGPGQLAQDLDQVAGMQTPISDNVLVDADAPQEEPQMASDLVPGETLPSQTTAQEAATAMPQMAAALQGVAAPVSTVKPGAPGSSTTEADLLSEPPRMFRGAADGAVPQSVQVRETPLPSNSAFARSSNVLELFANRPAMAPGMQTAAARAGVSASNGLANIAPLALNLPNGININNPFVTQSGQVPVMPLSTVYGIPNHVMMQVHPAITERSSPVESSLIASVPHRANSSMQLQLVPRSLGVIEMKIVNQNGNISIQIETETLEAQRLLRSETASMLETFRNAGLKLDDFNVNHNSRLEASASNERDNRQDGASFDQGRAGNGDQLNNRNSNGSSDNPFDAESYGMVDDTPLANPAESELARDGLYL